MRRPHGTTTAQGSANVRFDTVVMLFSVDVIRRQYLEHAECYSFQEDVHGGEFLQKQS